MQDVDYRTYSANFVFEDRLVDIKFTYLWFYTYTYPMGTTHWIKVEI